MEHPAIDHTFSVLFPGDLRELKVEDKINTILNNYSLGYLKPDLFLKALCEAATFFAGTGADEEKLCRVRDHINSLLQTEVEWDEIGLIPQLIFEGKTFPEIRKTLLQAA